MATERDVPMNITAPDVSAERRITPSWSISQLKAKLESVTGVPPGHQRLILRVPGTPAVALAASDEDSAQLSNWTLVAQAQIEVSVICVRCYPQSRSVTHEDAMHVLSRTCALQHRIQ